MSDDSPSPVTVGPLNACGGRGHGLRLTFLWLLAAAAWWAMRATVCVPHAGTLEHFLAFDAPLPFAARPLAPMLAAPLAATGWLTGMQAFLVIDALAFLLLLPGLRHALSALVSRPIADLGSVIVPLAMIPAVFISAERPPIFFPYDMTAAAFTAWGLGFALRRRFVALACLLPFATLNRETAILLPGAWFLLWWDRQPPRRFAANIGVLVLAFLVPRAAVLIFTRDNPRPYGGSLPLAEGGDWIINSNIGWLLHPLNLALWVAFLGFVPALLPLLRRHLSDAARRLLPLLVFQLAALSFSGKLDEARIYCEWLIVAGVMLVPAGAAFCGIQSSTVTPVLAETPRPARQALSGSLIRLAPVLVSLAAMIGYALLQLGVFGRP